MIKQLTYAAFMALIAIAISLPAFAAPSVSRSAFTREIVAREPAEASVEFPSDVGEVYFFTQILDAGKSEEIVHRWDYNGETVAEVSLHVEGPSWPTWSSKKVMPHQLGAWSVTVITAEGDAIETANFTITK